MISVVLLRGINVGGKNKVEMGRLRQTFERAGLDRVRTYINTGNVIFDSGGRSPGSLRRDLQAAITDEFDLELEILLRDIHEMTATAEAIPESWVNDSTMKCDGMFLWESVDSPDIIEELPIREGIDTVSYVPGAVIWKVDRPNLARSGMRKIVGTKLYKAMTVRNCNTVRKSVELMAEV